MNALTPMQRRFVIARFDNPMLGPSACLRIAGHKGNEEAVKKSAYRWSHHPGVLRAIDEYAQAVSHNQVPQAVGVFKDEMSNPKSPHRLRAAQNVLERVGLGAIRETKLTIEHKIDRADLLQKLAALVERHTIALPVKTETPAIPSGDAIVVDAEFVEASD